MTEKLRKSFLKEYGIWEYVLFGIGMIFLGRVGYEVIFLNIDEITWIIIGVLVLFLSLGALLVARPKSILDFARKRVGMEISSGNDAAKNNT